jgi:TM2 domain-containing membrane protein YozV
MEINEKQENYNQPYRSEKKVTAGILAILLGVFGVHKFYLGYTKAGIIQLILGLVTCGAVSIVGLIEGIIYLTKSDEEFDRTYVQNQKEWF